jgi:alanine racemase
VNHIEHLAHAAQGFRATRALVDLDAIDVNVRALRSLLPATTRLMAVVKADAYGHGAPWVASAAINAGASLLGVATVSEGEALRAHEIAAPIVILGPIDPEETDAALQADLEITIAEERLLTALQSAARKSSRPCPAPVHVKVDTGMRRYGAMPELAVSLAAKIAADPYLRLAGLCTHFASADEPDDPFTVAQWERFGAVERTFAAAGVTLPPRHVANSAAILTGRTWDCEIARAGIALYGVPPSDDVSLPPGMRPALRIESRVARVVPLMPGDSVGYNRTFQVDRHSRAALVPIGYADGYRRSLAGQAWMGLAGRRAQVIGRVSMDQTMIEVPDGVDARAGDPVHVLAGLPGNGAPSIAEMASLMDTNAYEVLVGVRRRIPRVYLRGGTAIGARRAGSFDFEGQ